MGPTVLYCYLYKNVKLACTKQCPCLIIPNVSILTALAAATASILPACSTMELDFERLRSHYLPRPLDVAFWARHFSKQCLFAANPRYIRVDPPAKHRPRSYKVFLAFSIEYISHRTLQHQTPGFLIRSHTSIMPFLAGQPQVLQQSAPPTKNKSPTRGQGILVNTWFTLPQS